MNPSRFALRACDDPDRGRDPSLPSRKSCRNLPNSAQSHLSRRDIGYQQELGR